MIPGMKIFDQLERRRTWEPEEQAILDAVRRVADEVIAPKAAGLRQERRISLGRTSRRINELGLNAMFVPEAYGGSPARYKLYLAVVKIISEACASTGIIYATNFHGMKPLIDFGSEEQKQRLLPRIADGGLASLAITEPSAGSDATGMRRASRRTATISSSTAARRSSPTASIADLLLVFGKWSEIDDAQAAPSRRWSWRRARRASRSARPEDKMGLRASSTAPLSFDKARVPRGNLLGRAGRRLEDPAGLAQQVAAQHRRARAGHRASPRSRT